MQELMVYAGQTESYGNCNEVIKKFIDIEVSPAQVYRVSDLYGEEVGKGLNGECILEPVRKDEVLYAQADGSMILTREKGWGEVKLGRVFKSSDCIHAGEKPGWISNSQYVAHFGGHKKFIGQMDSLLDSHGNLGCRLVFISDGATWIRNWIADAFPNAVSILDYYHAIEHLHEFSGIFFKDKELENKWAEEQKQLMLDGCIAIVIENIKKLAPDNAASKKLIAYYEDNKERMDYKRYKQIGCGIIGSGAIESSHRTVIQKRMKQSGQRWSVSGAQNMLNLRVVSKNGQWDKIVALSKKEFRKAA